jgi:hypothetical protein
MRKALFVVALLLSMGGILIWAAGVQWSTPLVASQPRHWDGSDFRVVIGGAAQDETRLRIGAVGENRTALQSLTLNGIDADDNPILRYRFEQFPHTLELSLVFRRVGDDDVSVVSLPWPGDGDAWFDLGTVPEWQGRITELAFAEYPTPQIVPPMQGFRPFTLVDASLYPRSWHGDLSALATDWLGQWPWSQRSVHALGRDTDTPRAQSLVLCLMLAIASAVIWSILILRLRGPELLRLSVVAVVLGWVLLDMQWDSGLRWRHAATRSLYAEFDWPERELHSADHDIVQTARELKTSLRDLPENSRILIHAGSTFTVLRLLYHLLPLNVGVLAHAVERTPMLPLPNGSVVVVYDAPDWRYDETRHLLIGGGLEYSGDLLLQRSRLFVVRLRSQP